MWSSKAIYRTHNKQKNTKCGKGLSVRERMK